MSYRSMTDIAYNFLLKKKKSVDFIKIWQEVDKNLEFPENKKGSKKAELYSDLMLDNRFASVEDNKWDLRNRRKFDEVYIDTDSIIMDDDEEIENEEEKEEDYSEE